MWIKSQPMPNPVPKYKMSTLHPVPIFHLGYQQKDIFTIYAWVQCPIRSLCFFHSNKGLAFQMLAFESVYSGQFTLTHLIKPNFCIPLSHSTSTTVSLETNPPIATKLPNVQLGYLQKAMFIMPRYSAQV